MRVNSKTVDEQTRECKTLLASIKDFRAIIKSYADKGDQEEMLALMDKFQASIEKKITKLWIK